MATNEPEQPRRGSWMCGPILQHESSKQSRRASWPMAEEKSVCFAKYSEMTYFKFPTDRENNAKWYSEEHMYRFKKTVLRDAAKQSNAYVEAKELSPDRMLSDEELAKYVGLLHLLSDDVIQRSREVKMARKLHVLTVLKEQEKQRRRKSGCQTKLARVSASSSLDARERAYSTATLFMMVDMID